MGGINDGRMGHFVIIVVVVVSGVVLVVAPAWRNQNCCSCAVCLHAFPST